MSDEDGPRQVGSNERFDRELRVEAVRLALAVRGIEPADVVALAADIGRFIFEGVIPRR